MTGRNVLLWCGVVALLGSLPEASAAQIAGGRSGFSTEQSLGAREYWDAVRYFGRCFASVSQAGAFELLATEPGSAAESTVANRLLQADSNCIPGVSRISFALPHLRGAIAEGLVSLGTAIPSNLVLTAPAPGATIANISEAARCYAATHRAEVRALLSGTRTGSAEELAALERMSPDFFRCVPPNARNYQFRATDVRYRLAEALLRLRPAEPQTQP
jgi:hypothetical protein